MDAWLWRWGNFLFVTSPDSIILTIWRLEQLERWLIWEEHPSPLVNAPGLSLPAELRPVGLLDCGHLRLELGLERQNLQRLTYMLAYCLVRDFVTFWGQSGSQFAGQLGTFGQTFGDGDFCCLRKFWLPSSTRSVGQLLSRLVLLPPPLHRSNGYTNASGNFRLIFTRFKLSHSLAPCQISGLLHHSDIEVFGKSRHEQSCLWTMHNNTYKPVQEISCWSKASASLP